MGVSGNSHFSSNSLFILLLSIGYVKNAKKPKMIVKAKFSY